MNGTTFNELPAYLPWINLGLSVAALVILFPVVFRRVQDARKRGQRWWLALDIALVAAVSVLIGGALFQANLLSVDHWTIVGTGGRAIVALILLTLLSLRPLEATS